MQASARAAVRARRAVIGRADGDGSEARARQLVSVPVENAGRTLGGVSISVLAGTASGTQQTLQALESSLGTLGDTLEQDGRAAQAITADDLLRVYARILSVTMSPMRPRYAQPSWPRCSRASVSRLACVTARAASLSRPSRMALARRATTKSIA
jgi:hypothetical protein